MMDVKKILVPVDFSDNSKQVLESATAVASTFGARLLVVFVVQSFDDYSGFFVPHMPVAKFEEELVHGAEGRMASFLEGVAGAESRVLSGDVAEVIVDLAREEKMDMIIMGTHGYKGLEKIMFGSVAEKVVKSAPCPVLTINPYHRKD